jgi:hypothetical protein
MPEVGIVPDTFRLEDLSARSKFPTLHNSQPSGIPNLEQFPTSNNP